MILEFKLPYTEAVFFGGQMSDEIQSKSEMKRQKALRESESVEGHIQIGDLIIDNVNMYHGKLWISRPDGEGMQVGENTLTELIELLEAFYRKHL